MFPLVNIWNKSYKQLERCRPINIKFQEIKGKNGEVELPYKLQLVYCTIWTLILVLVV